MKIMYAALVVLTGLLTELSYSQQTPAWTAIYQGKGDNADKFNKIIPDGAGNYICVGYTIKPGNYRDALVVKIDANGDTLWWRTKNGKGNGDDEALGAGVDASGNVYITGYVDAGTSQDNILTMKFDAGGVTLWDTTWDSPSMNDDDGVDLRIDGNGNCIVVGNTEPDTVAGCLNMITIKYAPNGAILWWDTLTNPSVAHGKDEAAALVIDAANNVYITGRSENMNANDDFVTAKYDGNSGIESWRQYYNGGNNDRAVDIGIDNLGDVVIAGSSNNGNNDDYRTNKYNSAGLLQWTRSLSAPANGDEHPSSLAIDGSNNIIVTGSADIDGSTLVDLNYQTIKYNPSGTLVFVKRDGNTVPQDDHGNDVVVDAAGNIYVTGNSDMDVDPLHVDNDWMTIAYNASGNILWGPIFQGGNHAGADDGTHSLYVDGSSNLYVAGFLTDTITHKNAAVAKYDAPTGNLTWLKEYNGLGDFNESAKSIVVDANDNSYACGNSFEANDNLNATIAKISPSGNILCVYEYKGAKNDDDEFNVIAISSNGFIYAAGYTKVINQKRNTLLVKWDPATCDTVWTRTYDYIGQSDRLELLMLDASGNVYVCGRSDPNPVDSIDGDDIITIKYDSNGNQLWLQRFNGTGNLYDAPAKMIFDNNGNIIVAGRTENVHDDDFVLLKYDINGGLVWGPVTWGGPFANDDRVTDATVDAANNIYVAGFSQTASGLSTNDPVILSYDQSGNQLGPMYVYTGEGKDEFVKIGFDSNGNLYVLNKFDSIPGILVNNYDFILLKLDAQLNPIWTNPPTYDSPIHFDDIPVDMTIRANGDVYITGVSDNDTNFIGKVNKNYVTLGYDDQGGLIFNGNWDATGDDDSPNALMIRGDFLWVCGNSNGSGDNQKDFTVINYNLFGVDVPKIKIDAIKSIAYPNPFNTECTIILNSEIQSFSFELTDVLGRTVMSPSQIKGNSIRIQKGNLAPGVYEYIIKSESSISAHGKIIIN